MRRLTSTYQENYNRQQNGQTDAAYVGMDFPSCQNETNIGQHVSQQSHQNKPCWIAQELIIMQTSNEISPSDFTLQYAMDSKIRKHSKYKVHAKTDETRINQLSFIPPRFNRDNIIPYPE